MSGIAGIFYLDGRPVEQETIDTMVGAMKHRGPDGIRTWREGSVALGHCMLHTTPESLHDNLPMESRDGNLVLTADARIDNREELMRILDLRPDRDRPVTDCDLIMAAYQKWGAACPEHLVGAFAFVVWNQNTQRIYCARDHLGVKPLYVHRDDNLFAFASEIKGLMSLPEIDCIIDESALLKSFNWIPLERSETMFRGIHKIRPASSVELGTRFYNCRTYWTVSPSSEAGNLSDRQCIDRFKDYFEEAVRCRLRTSSPAIAAELSGGLDSSSVVCMADKILKASNQDTSILTYSAVFDETTECDERKFINYVLSWCGLPNYSVNMNQYGPISSSGSIYRCIDDGEVGGGNAFAKWELWSHIDNSLSRVVLTGTDGDTAVMHGTEILAEYVKILNFEKFSCEGKAYMKRLSGEENDYAIQSGNLTSWQNMLTKFVGPYLSYWASNKNYIKFIRTLVFVSDGNPYKFLRIARTHIKKATIPEVIYRVHRQRNKDKTQQTVHPIISENYRDRPDLLNALDSIESQKEKVPSVRGQQLKLWKSGLLTTALENAEAFGAAHGLEPRHPYMDIRLLQFCLGMRSELSLQDGWTRYIVRQALTGILPEEVRLRTAKTSLAGMFDYGFLEVDYTLARHLSERLGILERYVNTPYLNSLLDQREENNKLDFTLAASILSKVLWLAQLEKRFGKQPVIR